MPPPNPSFNEYQRHMYKIEKLINYRFLYRLLASKSSHALQIEDAVSKEIHREIQLIGEFADVSYSPISLERVFERMELFSRKHFPLEGYEAVTSSKLVLAFEGEVANVAGLVAYRPTVKQLVVGICGTRTIVQVLHDLNSMFQHCTKGEQSYRVHSGFMSMYAGLEAHAFRGIRKGLEGEQVEELVVSFPPLKAAHAHLTERILAHWAFDGSCTFLLPCGRAVDERWDAPSGDTNQGRHLWFTSNWGPGICFLLEKASGRVPVQPRSRVVSRIQRARI